MFEASLIYIVSSRSALSRGGGGEKTTNQNQPKKERKKETNLLSDGTAVPKKILFQTHDFLGTSC
jgi:hypothetical protein